MAFDVKKRPVKRAWFSFSEDESYYLQYFPRDEWTRYAEEHGEEELQKLLFSHVIEWKGIFDGEAPLPCNDENKAIVFLQSDIWSVERLQFVMFNVLNADGYFNYDQNLKNLKRASR